MCYCPDGRFRQHCLPRSGNFKMIFDLKTVETGLREKKGEVEVGHLILHCVLVQTSTARTLSCPCRNGGVCSISGSPLCSCRNGFTGRFCENLLRN